MSNEPLNWKQAEAALQSPDVQTMRGLFLHFSELPVRAKTREFYAELEERERDFDSLDAYIMQFYQQTAHYEDAKKLGLDMAPEAIRDRLTARITWRQPEASLDDVTRVYILSTSQPTKLSRILEWDVRTYFHIFTDDEGRLLGWIRIE